MIKKNIILLVFSSTLLGCAGYQVKKNHNPLALYQINSVSVPLFINKSVFANVSESYTRKIINLLDSYKGLRVYIGEYAKADAILIGTIKSNNKKSHAITTTLKKLTEGELQESIGKRLKFYVPSTGTFKLRVNLILIKNPKDSDIKLAKSSLSSLTKNSPKVIFNKDIDISGDFNYIVNETKNINSEGFYNFTRSNYALNKAIKNSAQKLSEIFKGALLDVF